MAVYLARTCPMCRNYFGVVIAKPEGGANSQPIHGGCLPVATKSTGPSFQVMAQSAVDKIRPAQTAKSALTKEHSFEVK